MKIYDSFLFFNELDLLEIRLEMLYDYVDYFIISECDTTFSGLKKPFYFEENKERYSKFLDKIIYVKNEDSGSYDDDILNKYDGDKGIIFSDILKHYYAIKYSPLTDHGKPHWCRDFLHREFVKLGMTECEDDDIIIFSDLDEIPDPKKLIFDGGTYLIHQKNIIYYLNCENVTEKWHGSVVTNFSNIKNESLNKIRNEFRGYNLIGNTNNLNFKIIENGGWHLTFMGGMSRISEKIKSYGHQEFNNDSVISQISDKMNNNLDILNRGIKIEDVNIDEYYPEEMVNLIKQKYPYLIKNI